MKTLSPTVLVNDYGVIYRLPRKDYLRWLREFAAGDSPSLTDFGATVVGQIEVTVDGCTPSEARELLSRGGAS